MGDIANDLLDALYDLARENSCHGLARPHERDRAVKQWHNAVSAIDEALTREPLPTGTAGVVITEEMVEAAAKMLAYRLVGCTEKGWNGDTVFTAEQKAQILDDARVMLTAALAAATGRGEDK